jgi:hypothetical protein
MLLEVAIGSLSLLAGLTEATLLVITRRKSFADRDLRQISVGTRRRWLRAVRERAGGDVPTSFLLGLVRRPGNHPKFRFRVVLASWLIFFGIGLLIYGIFQQAELGSIVVGASVFSCAGSLLPAGKKTLRSTRDASALLEHRQPGTRSEDCHDG